MSLAFTPFQKRILLLFAAVLAYQLLIPPIVGLANNGDFDVVMGIFRLVPSGGAPEDNFFRYVVPKYAVDPQRPPLVPLFTTAHLALIPAWLVNLVVSKDGFFDLRWTGLTYGLLALAALALVLPLFEFVRGWRRIVLPGVLLLVYADPQYVAQMNSFYADAAAFAYLMLAVAFYLRRVYQVGNAKWNAWGLAGALVLFVGAKSQHSLLAFPLLALLVWQGRTLAPLGRAARAGALALIGLVGAICAGLTPREYTAQAYYNVVFLELLPNVQNQVGLMRELGLNDEWIAYSGTGAYTAGTAIHEPGFRSEFLPRASHFRLAWYFLRHPGVAWRLILEGMREAAYQRPYIGNFARSEGLPPSHKSEAFYLWSRWKYHSFLGRPIRQFGYSVLTAAFAVALAWKRRRELFPGVLAVAVMAGIELGLGALADVAETTRHLFLFLAFIDLLMVSLVFCAVLPRRAAAPAAT